MAYFSNGTEGMIWEQKWCSRCVHQDPSDGDGCPILTLHVVFNGDEGDVRTALDMLIPNGNRGPGKCALFFEKAQQTEDAS